MIIGLIGLANSGKTTIFNALTRSEAEVTAYASSRTQPNLASVDVIDERVARLSEMYKPRKTTHASLDIIDFVGMSKGSAQEGIISSLALGLIKNTDALALVVRNFRDDLAGEPALLDDIDEISTELLLSDLIITEKRLEKIAQAYRKGLKDPALEREEKILERIRAQLESSQPIRDLDLAPDERKLVRSFHFLTKKPLMVVVNSDEDSFGRSAGLLAAIGARHAVIEFAGSFEMELARLDEEEARAFMDDMGIASSARDRLTQLAYATLGYISFFTVGSDEVRAWNIVKGASALDAAGSIHTDLARGFIRAECFSFDDLIACGSEKAVREKGLFRLEGKSYIVADGDILSIRFSV
jgi:GTP-binding protein YchF